MVTMSDARVAMTPLRHQDVYYVVHPLDDVQEQKRNAEDLGPMPMTTAVKWSLFTLRGYLISMGVLVLYHVLALAGLFHHAH